MFEYKVLNIGLVMSPQAHVDKVALEGWRLVAAAGDYIYFEKDLRPNGITKYFELYLGEVARTKVFEKCLENSLALWQALHPDRDYWPDGAESIALALDRFTWVPVAERLPSDGQQVIVVYDRACMEDAIDMAVYKAGKGPNWWHSPNHAFSRTNDIIKAWMPGPAAYKVSREVDDE